MEKDTFSYAEYKELATLEAGSKWNLLHYFWNLLFLLCHAKDLNIPIHTLVSYKFSRPAKLGIRIKMDDSEYKGDTEAEKRSTLSYALSYAF